MNTRFQSTHLVWGATAKVEGVEVDDNSPCLKELPVLLPVEIKFSLLYNNIKYSNIEELYNDIKEEANKGGYFNRKGLRCTLSRLFLFIYNKKIINCRMEQEQLC